MIEITERAELPAGPDDVFAVVGDLARYPEWLSIVPRAVAVGDDVWRVDLRGRIGPLSRAKRLRMQRTVHDAPHHARFERREDDGREHAEWVLDAVVDATGDESSRLVMTLRYGGSLWVPMLDRLLRQEIDGSKPRLAAIVAPRPDAT